MMLKRKIDQFLSQWKSREDRLPLIVKGARQVGKTSSISAFANTTYPNVISINFVIDHKFPYSYVRFNRFVLLMLQNYPKKITWKFNCVQREENIF